MQFEFPSDELEWIDQQIAGVRASVERLRYEIAEYENELSRLRSARERATSTKGGAIVIPFSKERPIATEMSQNQERPEA